MIIFIINTTEYKQTVLSLRKTHPRRSVPKGHTFIEPSQAHMETRLGNITWWTGVITSSLPYSQKSLKRFGVFFVRLERHGRLGGNCADSSVQSTAVGLYSHWGANEAQKGNSVKSGVV